MSVRRDHASFFADLRTVVIDEVHSFGGDDRGWHLLAVLDRLAVVAGRDLQRIGLVGNGRWTGAAVALAGQVSRGLARVVAPDARADVSIPEVTLDHVGSPAHAATVISRLHAAEKQLAFCDSRARVEEFAVDLRERGVNTFVSHSSLALDERRRAEDAFAETPALC